MKISGTVRRRLFPIVICVVSVLSSVVCATHTAADNTGMGGVLVGPCGLPGAEGPTGINDDFTNRSINAGIANLSPESVTTAPGAVVFRNMVQNIGTGDDAFVITVPSAPEGFRIEISFDEGVSYTALDSLNTNVTLPVAHGAAAIFFMRITAPAGLKVLTGFDTLIRARSTITPTVTNDTIDRLYTGFIRLEKTISVDNQTGAGGPNDAVSGAEIEFAIKYTNISTAVGIGSSQLTAHNLVINEDGKAPPNNWAATTDHVTGASDTQAGIIIGDRDGSTFLSDIVTTLEAGQSGLFKFKRRIK